MTDGLGRYCKQCASTMSGVVSHVRRGVALAQKRKLYEVLVAY